jgi:glycosyltransferase involved in cell wall biosynthesis
MAVAEVPVKVLMVNTPAAPRFRGGDLTQMRQTALALRSLGVEVAESFDAKPSARGFDLAHVFNLRTIQVTPGQVQHLKSQRVPVLLSPVYLNPALATWGTRVITNIFRTDRAPAELDRLLDGLARRKLTVKRPGGAAFAADAQNRPRNDFDQWQRETLRQVDYVLPNSYLEMDQLVRTLRVTGKPFTVVPYAADALTFLDPDPGPFRRRFGLREFVLQVGRIEVSKNQLMLARALRDLDVPLVFIGGSLQRRYLDWCRKHGPKHLRVLPHMPAAGVASAYAAARVHALPSWIETCGLVTMEAALANCNVVASIAGYEIEYFREWAYYCDPSDVASIRSAVTDALQNYDRDATRRLRLKQLILSQYTWERAAELTHQAYCRVLAGGDGVADGA